MQNFKDFINEEHTEPNYIEVDSRMIEHNKDAINADFDRLTAQPYTNAIVFFNQVKIINHSINFTFLISAI